MTPTTPYTLARRPALVVANKLRAEPSLTGPVAVPAEGTVLPDGYSFEHGEARGFDNI